MEKKAKLKESWSRTRTSNGDGDNDVSSADVRPFFGSENQVHILQVGDNAFKKTKQSHASLNKKWAKCADYQYHFKTFDDNDDNHDTEPEKTQPSSSVEESTCVYTQKVKVIRDFFMNFTSIPVVLGDWMIFVDLDAYYQEPNCQELEHILLQQQHLYDRHYASTNDDNTHNHDHDHNHSPPIHHHQCEVIAHTCSAGINSGLLIMKITDQTRTLMEAWYQHQLHHGFCLGPADQWALQEVMLEHYQLGGDGTSKKSPLEECLALDAGPTTYTRRGGCSKTKLNVFKQQAMEALPLVMTRPTHFETLPLGTNVCLFDCQSVRPLQCHDCERDEPLDGVTRPGTTKGHSDEKRFACLRKQPLFHHHPMFVEQYPPPL